MRSTSSTLTGIVLFVGLVAFSAFVAVGASASTPKSETTPISAKKTYKRKCTNSKCRAITEQDRPIFKCPICGSNTTPVK